jgi:hypothetical protein
MKLLYLCTVDNIFVEIQKEIGSFWAWKFEKLDVEGQSWAI